MRKMRVGMPSLVKLKRIVSLSSSKTGELPTKDDEERRTSSIRLMRGGTIYIYISVY